MMPYQVIYVVCVRGTDTMGQKFLKEHSLFKLAGRSKLLRTEIGDMKNGTVDPCNFGVP